MNDSFTFTRLIGLVAIMGDKDAESMLEQLEPVLDEIVVTRNSSPRSMSPRDLGELATEVFERTGCTSSRIWWRRSTRPRISPTNRAVSAVAYWPPAPS